jgi:hypothetical protein
MKTFVEITCKVIQRKLWGGTLQIKQIMYKIMRYNLDVEPFLY